MMKSNFFSAAVFSGLIAGAVFIILEMILISASHYGSFWEPPRMISALAMGQDVLIPPETFDFGTVLVGLLIHFVLSILFTMIIGAVVARIPMAVAIVIGLIAGLLLYYINFYGFSNIFTWFGIERNWATLITHMVYGIIAAWMFKLFFKRYVAPQYAA